MKKHLILSAALFACAAGAYPAAAGGRTVVGTITGIDREARTFSVTDGMGVRWNFKAIPDAEIDLARFGEGDRVSVSISRATPLNMMVTADQFRKGDKLLKIPY